VCEPFIARILRLVGQLSVKRIASSIEMHTPALVQKVFGVDTSWYLPQPLAPVTGAFPQWPYRALQHWRLEIEGERPATHSQLVSATCGADPRVSQIRPLPAYWH